MDIVEDFDEKIQQPQTLEIVEDFACEDKTFEIFGAFALTVFIFLHVSSFFQFFFFQRFFFIFLIFS